MLFFDTCSTYTSVVHAWKIYALISKQIDTKLSNELYIFIIFVIDQYFSLSPNWIGTEVREPTLLAKILKNYSTEVKSQILIEPGLTISDHLFIFNQDCRFVYHSVQWQSVKLKKRFHSGKKMCTVYIGIQINFFYLLFWITMLNICYRLKKECVYVLCQLEINRIYKFVYTKYK